MYLVLMLFEVIIHAVEMSHKLFIHVVLTV